MVEHPYVRFRGVEHRSDFGGRIVEDVPEEKNGSGARRERLEGDEEGVGNALAKRVSRLGEKPSAEGVSAGASVSIGEGSQGPTYSRRRLRRRKSTARFVATRNSHGRHGVGATGCSRARRKVSWTISSASAATPVIR
jgi:hypothetical protein